MIVVWAARAQAQEIAVPINVQVPLFLKIFTLDRNLKARVGLDIVVGIVYQSKFRTSLNVKDEFMAVLERETTQQSSDIPIHCVPINLNEETDLATTIVRQHIDMLYITPVRALEIETIARISRAKQIMTFTGVPEYVPLGITVGTGIKGGKPRILINIKAAKAEGVNFNSQLLKLATIID